MKMNKPAKYAFLTDEEYRTCDAYISSAFSKFFHRKK